MAYQGVPVKYYDNGVTSTYDVSTLDTNFNYVSGKMVSVKDASYGAKGDGVTDDTAAINAALIATAALGKALFFPAGTYLVSSSLNAPTASVLIGENLVQTFIKRTPTMTGHTLIMGQALPGLRADGCRVQNLNFVRPITFNGGQAYNPGVSTTVDNKLAASAAHILVNGSQVALFENCELNDMPRGITLLGCTLTTLRKCNFSGSIWDDQVVGLQEATAQLFLANDPTAGACTLITVDDCYFSGKYSSPTRTVTIGATTANFAYGVGPSVGLRAEGVEGLCVSNTYLGGHNSYSIGIIPNSAPISSNIKITNNFFDGAFLNCIYFGAATDSQSTLITIGNNIFNGEQSTGHMIFVDIPFAKPTAYSLGIHGNVMMGCYACAMYLVGAYGANVSNNIVSDYNHYGGNAGNPVFTAGVYTLAPGDKVYTATNQWGGGTNLLGATNNCQWGVYLDGVFTFGCAATGEHSMGLGLAGGAIVNVAQSYPA